MHVDQSEFVRPFLPPSNDLRVSVFFVKFGDVLDGTPAGDVPLFAFPENTVKEPRRAKQSNMSAVKRRNRTSLGRIFPRQQDR